MAKLPHYIRLVKFNSTDKCTLKTLKDYFNSFPYIAYTDYELNDEYFYYILPNTDTICHIIWNIRNCLEDIDLEIFRTAAYYYDSAGSNALHTYIINANAWDYAVLPKQIKIDPNDVKKLEIFRDDSYDYTS